MRTKRIHIKPGVSFSHDTNGLPTIHAPDLLQAYHALGYAHALDRLQQTLITRLAVNGELTQYLADTEETYAIDFVVRKMRLKASAQADVDNLHQTTHDFLTQYTQGFNAGLNKRGRPLLFKLLGYTPPPWSITDCLGIINLQMYLGMAQIQEGTERLIIQSIQQGVDITTLKRLYAPHLDDLSEELVELIKHTSLHKPFLAKGIEYLQTMNLTPKTAVSNNWAVSPLKSQSGHAMLCFDPHLQINRLPNFWYECAIHLPDDYLIGITAPGVPFLIMGRSKALAGGFTYGLMDVIDFFIEDCQDNQVKRGDSWEPINLRTEVFQRKKHGTQTVTFHETDTGIIESRQAEVGSLNDGQYFALAWSGHHQGASRSMNALSTLWQSRSVEEALVIARQLALPCNWLFADTTGNIGYQQSGSLPNRIHSGLYPLPAWDRANHWQGLISPQQLASDYNPESGFLATANQDVNQPGLPLSINTPYSSYRHERICHLLSKKNILSIDDMQRVQADLHSLQAQRYLELMKPLLPHNELGRLLMNWDCNYDKSSQAATLFEAIYYALLSEVAGKHIFGDKTWHMMLNTTAILPFIHANLDTLILNDDSLLGSRNKLFKDIIERVLADYSNQTLNPWGKQQQFTLTNIYFDGKLPRWLGFDRGPYPLEGNRCTVSLGDIFYEGNRRLAGGSSYRFITEMSKDEVYSVLIGGASERRFSSHYISDLKRWLNHEYKITDMAKGAQ